MWVWIQFKTGVIERGVSEEGVLFLHWSGSCVECCWICRVGLCRIDRRCALVVERYHSDFLLSHFCCGVSDYHEHA